ncbi:MAG: WG repeat-containing protein [Mangrovibacterium sp.]
MKITVYSPLNFNPPLLKNIIYYCSILLVSLNISCKENEDNDDLNPTNGFTNETGMQTDLYPINQNGYLSYINTSGEVILNTTSAYLSNAYFYNDRAKVSISVQLNEARVYRDTIIGYASIEDIYNNTPYYGVYTTDTDELKREYYALSGKELNGYEYGDIITEPYYEIQHWYGYKYGMIDRAGNTIIPPSYINLGRYSKSKLTYTGDEQGAYRYHDFDGDIVRIASVEKCYKSATNFKTKHAITQNFNDSIFIIIDEYFEATDTIHNYYNSQSNANSWSNVNEFCNMMCRIEHYSYNEELGFYQAKYGFANTSGTIIIPVQFNYAMNFYNDYSLYEQNGFWGYLGTGGRTAIEAQYIDAHPFVEEISSAKKLNGEWVLIDKQNNILSENRFKATGVTSSELTAFIPINSATNLYGFMNNKGEVIIEPRFYSSSYYTERVIDSAFWGELALVELNETTSAYITKKGEVVWVGETGTQRPIIQKKTPRGQQIAPQQFKERLAEHLELLY